MYSAELSTDDNDNNNGLQTNYDCTDSLVGGLQNEPKINLFTTLVARTIH